MEAVLTGLNLGGLDYTTALEYEKDINREQCKVELIEQRLSVAKRFAKELYDRQQATLRLECMVYEQYEIVRRHVKAGSADADAVLVAAREKCVQYQQENAKLKRALDDCLAILRRLHGSNSSIIDKAYKIIDAYGPELRTDAVKLELETAKLDFEKLCAQLHKTIEYYVIASFVSELSIGIREDYVDGGDTQRAERLIKQCKPLLVRLKELNTFTLTEGAYYDTFAGDYEVVKLANWSKLSAQVRDAREKLGNSIYKQMNDVVNIATDFYGNYSAFLKLSDDALSIYRDQNPLANPSDERKEYLDEMLAQVSQQKEDCILKIANIKGDRTKCQEIIDLFYGNVVEDVNHGAAAVFSVITEFFAVLTLENVLFAIPCVLTMALGSLFTKITGQSAFDSKINQMLPNYQKTLDYLQERYPNLIRPNDDFIINRQVREAENVLAVVAKVDNMNKRLLDEILVWEAEERYLELVERRMKTRASQVNEITEENVVENSTVNITSDAQ